MKNYQEFINDAYERLNQMLEDVDVSPRQVIKNNGTKLDALIFARKDVNIAPTIYLRPFYGKYLEGISEEEIYDEIISIYRSNQPTCDFDVSVFTDFDKCKDRIIMKLINYGSNKELLEDLPHLRYLDLAITFCCLISREENSQASIQIHNEHSRLWGVTTDQLLKYAKINTPALLPFKLTSMIEIVRTMVPANASIEELNELSNILVLSNEYGSNGATALLYDGLLIELSQKYDSDLLIIPSSIHETIIIPIVYADEMADYSQIIKEVNDTELEDVEVLSDHPYFYSRQDGFVKSLVS